MNTIDTRDLLKRKNELEALRDALLEAEDAVRSFDSDAPDGEDLGDLKAEVESAQTQYGADEAAELEELETLENEISDFRHGEAMIPVEDFTEYAEELANDVCSMKNAREWPFCHVDWEAAANALAQDYSTVTYQGSDYYVRA